MTIDEYGQWVAGDRSPGQSRDERLIYCALDLFGEAGEIADTIRKMMREGVLDEDYLVYELGDVFYHWACLVAELGQTPSVMLERSRSNIEARRAGGRQLAWGS
jgi:NTP pyrophosphatase (non-canonical NTP hydrolase)